MSVPRLIAAVSRVQLHDGHCRAAHASVAPRHPAHPY